MRFSKALVILFLLIPISSSAQEYTLMVDKFYSPHAGASFATFILDAYKELTPELTEKKWYTRLLALTAESQVSSFMIIMQHEVFGHGYRLRSGGPFLIGYLIEPPYRGATYYMPIFSDTIPLIEEITIAMGGMEATETLAESIKVNAIKQQTVDSRSSSLYLKSKLDKMLYIQSEQDSIFIGGHDIQNYTNHVNTWHETEVINVNRLKKNSCLELLDPFIYQSVYRQIDYLFGGSKQARMPFIYYKNYTVLPSARLNLAPWGIEQQIEAYVLEDNERLYKPSISYGKNNLVKSFGINLSIDPIYKVKDSIFSMRISLWRQPDLFQKVLSSNYLKKTGGAIFTKAEYKVSSAAGIVAEVGYKSEGYLIAEPLLAEAIWRIGIKLYI